MQDISGDPLNGSLGAVDEPHDTGFVRDSCANQTHQKLTKSISFPKPAQTCEWEKNGNLQTRDQYFQARIEETQQLILPADAIICDIKMNFAEQQFLYDDHFLMTFNNAVVASSFDFSAQLNSEYGLLRYDWSRIAGMFWDKTKEGTFCAPGSVCDWPVTDTAGVITMQYPTAVIQRLMAEDINRTKHILKFISIGDNDDKDCEHSNVDFSLDVDYVTKQ